MTAACAGRVLPPPPAAPDSLAVVSWNMAAGRGDVRQLAHDLSAGLLTPSPVDAFVLLLQETAEENLQDLPGPAGADLDTFFVPVRRGPGRATGNAIVATGRLGDRRVIELPRERQPRAAAVSSIAILGERLFVVSTHLENRLGWTRGLFGDRARRRQAAALIAALPPDGYGILGGDMNTMLGPGEAALDALRERFDDTPAEPLAPTFGDRLVLDHLFFDLPDGWIAWRGVIENRYGSDHHPVLGIVIPMR